MKRRFIKVVTVTGADDSVKPEDLSSIARKDPIIEFGILLSKRQRGHKRFPSEVWLEKLYRVWSHTGINLSGHLCGQWVSDLLVGKPTFFEEFGSIWRMFKRIQLNFHAQTNIAVNMLKLPGLLREYFFDTPIIFQIDGVNDEIFHQMKIGTDLSVFPLYDKSGGIGLLPDEWPKQHPNQYSGYAGGLSPDNLEVEIEKISKAASRILPIWIDAETLLRSKDDTLFDLEKVLLFLKAAKPYTLTR